MKVRMKSTIRGLVEGQRATAGAVIDVPDANGADLCSKGLAEPVAEPNAAKAEKRTAAKKSTKD